MDEQNPASVVYFTKYHYGTAAFIFVVWAYILLKNDHMLGCPSSHGLLYNKTIHFLTLVLYMGSHALVIYCLEKMNKPMNITIIKMGNVTLILRKLKFFLFFRFLLISAWLLLVFFENAEEGYYPVGILVVHLLFVLFTIFRIDHAVRIDNYNLDLCDRMVFSTVFKVSASSEIWCSAVWLVFNVFDVYYCHEWYSFGVTW